jgi:hypothetical protein
VVVDFEHFGYKVIKKGGEVLRCHLMSGTEEARAALRFDFILALEVDGWRRVEQRLDWFQGGRLGQLDAGENMEKLEWTGWAEMSRWAIIED